MIRLLLIGCLSFLIIGCAQSGPEFGAGAGSGFGTVFGSAQQPSSGDTARLRGIGTLYVFPSNCGEVTKLRGGVLIKSGPFLTRGMTSSGYKGRSIGMPETKYSKNKEEYGEMLIRANEPITVSFVGSNYISSCTVNGSFSPEINHDYEARGYISGRKCYFGVTDITNGQETPVQLSEKRLRCPEK